MLKFGLYFIIVTLLSLRSVNAQLNFNNYTSASIDTILDYGYSIIQDHSGNYVSCGKFHRNSSFYAGGYLVKLNSCGNVIWKKKFDLTTDLEGFNDIIELPDKNYLIAGSTSVTNYTINSNAFLAKVDTNGSLLWFKQYIHPDFDFSYQLEITSDNNIIILGYSTDVNDSNGDVLLIKADNNGNLIWRKRIGSTTYQENYSSFKIIDNTKYLLGGTEKNYSTSDKDIGIMKIDTAGNVLLRKLNGTTNFDEACNSIISTLDGGYILGGTSNNAGRLWKLDSVGILKWTEPQSGRIAEVNQLIDSNLIIIANDKYLHNSSNATVGYLFKADKNGILIWEKFYPVPPFPVFLTGFYDFVKTNDNGYAIVGVTNRFSPTDVNTLIIKTDSLGNDSSSCIIIDNVNEIDITKNATLFPNPNNGNFTINLNNSNSQNEAVEIIITNIVGEICYFSNTKLDINNNIELNNLSLLNGIYFVRLNQNNKIVFQSKFVVQ